MIRRSKPHRKPVWTYLISAALLVSGGYLLYELGRQQGGYSVLDQRREREGAVQTLIERNATIEDLRQRLTVLSTAREIDRETYAQVEMNLSQLQARIQAQEEELAFYQGIVSPEDGAAGLRIQALEVTPTDSEQRYTLHMVLVQAIIHDQRVAGIVKFNIAGTRAGEPLEFELADLTVDGESGEIAYGFRYFQGLDKELVLPVGFEPDRIDVEISPREPRGQKVSQSFPWSSIVG